MGHVFLRSTPSVLDTLLAGLVHGMAGPGERSTTSAVPTATRNTFDIQQRMLQRLL